MRVVGHLGEAGDFAGVIVGADHAEVEAEVAAADVTHGHEVGDLLFGAVFGGHVLGGVGGGVAAVDAFADGAVGFVGDVEALGADVEDFALAKFSAPGAAHGLFGDEHAEVPGRLAVDLLLQGVGAFAGIEVAGDADRLALFGVKILPGGVAVGEREVHDEGDVFDLPGKDGRLAFRHRGLITRRADFLSRCVRRRAGAAIEGGGRFAGRLRAGEHKKQGEKERQLPHGRSMRLKEIKSKASALTDAVHGAGISHKVLQ